MNFKIAKRIQGMFRVSRVFTVNGEAVIHTYNVRDK